MEAMIKAMQHYLRQLMNLSLARSSYFIATSEVCGMREHTRNFCQFNAPYYPNEAPYWDDNVDYTTNYNNIIPILVHTILVEKTILIFPTKTTHLHPQKSSLETALETFIFSCDQNQQFNPQFEEMQVSPRQAQPPEFNYSQPPQNSNLEILLEEFISTQEKMNKDFKTSLNKMEALLGIKTRDSTSNAKHTHNNIFHVENPRPNLYY